MKDKARGFNCDYQKLKALIKKYENLVNALEGLTSIDDFKSYDQLVNMC